MWINRCKNIIVRPAAQSFLVYVCEKIRCGTNVARLRISVWFVGDPEVICPGSGLVLGSRLVGSDLCAWHRLWTDYGLFGNYDRLEARIEGL